MKQVEQEFNKRFRNKKQSDDGFDSDGLWNSISEDLKKKPAIPTNQSNGQTWKWGLLCALFLGCFTAALFFYLKKPTNAPAMKPEVAISLEQNALKTTKNAKSIGENHVNEGFTKEKPTKSNARSFSKNQGVSAERSVSKLESKALSQHEKTHFDKIEYGDRTSKVKSIDQYNGDAKTAAFSNSRIERNKLEISKLEKGKSKTVNRMLNEGIIPLPSKLISFQQRELRPTLFTNPFVLGMQKKSSTPFQWQFGMETGINTIAFNNKSTLHPDIANLKNGAEQLQIGSSFGFHAGVLLKDKWTVQSGVEYHQLWSKLDIHLEKNIVVSKTNQLLKVWVDASTVDTLKTTYGDTNVDAIETKHVVHYNRYNQFRIPLEFGVQQHRKNVLYGASIGAVFNFTTAQTGRTLDHNSDIITFENKTQAATLKASSIGFRISPLLGYQFANHWALYMRPQWTVQGNKGIFDSDIKISAHQINVNVGLRYSLH